VVIYCCNDREYSIQLIMNGLDFILFYEDYARHKLAEYWDVKPKNIRHLSKENPMSDFDLLFGRLKIDVKCSSPVIISKGKKPIWDFSLRKSRLGKRVGQKYESDCFVLIGIKNGIPKSIYLIPSAESPTNHIRISLNGNSKYEKYKLF
jgi:hypothetical protein